MAKLSPPPGVATTEPPYGWVSWYASSYSWSESRPSGALLYDIRPATLCEKEAFERIKNLEEKLEELDNLHQKMKDVLNKGEENG